MLSKRVLLLVVCMLIVLPVTAHADDTITVYAPSGNYSIDVPTGWIVDTESPPSSQLLGENLVVASSQAVLDAYQANQPIDGSIVVVACLPIDIFQIYASSTAERQFDLDGKTGDALLEAIHIRGAKMDIDGYPARRYRERSGLFGEGVHFGETNVLVGRRLFRFTYTSPDMADTEAIVDSLNIYSEPNTDFERPPLALDNGTIDLEPGWLVLRWGFGVPFGSSRIQWGDTSTGDHYAVLVEKQDEFLPLLYSTQQVSGAAVPFDLPGTVVIVGMHPYDQLFGSADVPVDQSHREMAFEWILDSLPANADGNPQLAVVDGAPALTAPLTRVFRRPNQGQLTVIDTNYMFYSILVAAPPDAWDPTRADEILARVHITPPPPVAAGDVGTGSQIGLYAPDFTLPLVDGSVVSLSDYRGKVVLLNFWAIWCSACVEEMDEFQAYYAEHSDEAVILAVDYREPRDEVAAFVEENGLTYPVALDLDGEVNALYRIHKYPSIYIIDAEGIIDAIPFAQADAVWQIEDWVDAAMQ